MRRMASPAALSRTLSLQRANARAKSSRGESFSDKKAGSQLSKRIDILFKSNISFSNNVTDSCNIDAQSKSVSDPSKQLALQGDDDCRHINAMKRSFSADIPSGYKACFSSLSERIDKGMDLWDRDFSSMSSYASDQDGFLWGLQRKLNSGSNILCASKGEEVDACSKSSSWSEEDSLVDAIQMEDEASSNAYRLKGLNGIDCTSGFHSHIAHQNLQGDARCTLQTCDKHKSLLAEYSADYEDAEIIYKVRNAGDLDAYLSTRSGASCTHSFQSASARDEEAKLQRHSTKEEGVGNSNRYTSSIDSRSSTTRGDYYRVEGVGSIHDSKSRGTADGIIHDGSSREDDEKGEVTISSKKDACDDSYKLRVRSKRDYDKLEEEIMSSKRDYDNLEGEKISSKRDKDSCTRKRVSTDEEGKNEVEKRGALLRLPPDSVAVEVVSLNMIKDFRESMYEMMMEKDMEEECEDNSMQDLLNCYLLLNPSQLHGIIREVFSDVWIDIIMAIR